MKISVFSAKSISLAIILLFACSIGYGQKIEVSGIINDVITGEPVSQVKLEAVDKYTSDIYATVLTGPNGEFSLLCPASERVIIKASRSNYRTANWTFREVSDKMFAQENIWLLSPVQVGVFDYFISFSKDSVQNIHLIIREADSKAMILSDSIRHVKEGLKLRLKKNVGYDITMSAQDRFVRKWELMYSKGGHIILKDWLNQPEEHYTYIDSVQVIPELNHQIRLAPIELNTIIEIKGITYELGKTYLNKEATGALEKAIELIKLYPDVLFEIGNHSKDWDDPQKNLELSISRAQVAADYLVEWADLQNHNISSKGYGNYQMPEFCPGKSKCKRKNQLEPHVHSITTLKVIGKTSKFASQRIPEPKPKVLRNEPQIKSSVQYDPGKINFIPAEFTGKALQVLYTSKLLPDGHPMFSEKDLFVDRRKIGGYSYLIPIPENINASTFAKKYIAKYEDAFIVSYFKGVRE